ncbi:GntR family transcriptional regulator, partial [Nonomuraea sp. NN258]|uniref:TetR/AcrR family transcriptional regulator C-terminal domain-containing protein n=1 Tax=Nonomuraea antri TaxID=2730852 RepID=UPI00156998F1
VGGQAELVQRMADAAFAEIELPEPPPGWRSHLRQAAVLQWRAYHRHPWLARLVSVTRPVVSPGMVRYAVWTMRALDGLPIDADTRIHVYAAVVNHVRGTAMNIEGEIAAEQDTGKTSGQWLRSRLPVDGPLVTRVTDPAVRLDLESLFAFGLERLLDGLTPLLSPRRQAGAANPEPTA